MRVLDTHTGRFVDFTNWRRVQYAILSHTWNGAEQTYQEVRAIQKNYGPDGRRLHLDSPPAGSSLSPDPSSPLGDAPTTPASTDGDTIWNDPALSEKVRRSCETARAHGYRYLWIDSCCIDKTSSSELSEAINSMYVWYRDASVCYAYIADVEMDADPEVWKIGLRMSRWFTRGWTLQELVAPRNIVFLTKEWLVIGTKVTLVADIEFVTGIESDVLMHRRSLDEVSVARRMCWAATRQTTRVEDEAYSLLGIFDINMPTLYGEGDRAFRRLQEEILKRIPDQSIFAWDTEHPYTLRFLEPSIPSADSARSTLELLGTHTVPFAGSPHAFFRTSGVSPLPHGLCQRYLGLTDTDHPLPDYTQSPYGMRIHFPMLSVDKCFSPRPFRIIDAFGVGAKQWFLVILGCKVDSYHEEHMLARLCCLNSSRAGAEVLKGMGVCRNPPAEQRTDLFVVTPADINRLRAHLEVRTVYLPHPYRALPPTIPLIPGECPDVVLSPWTSAVLEAQGYRVEHFGPNEQKPDNHQFTLSRDGTTLCLELQFSPHDCALMAWCLHASADVSASVPDPTLQQARKVKYLIHKDGFEPIDMRTADGGTLTLKVRFEVDAAAEPDAKNLFYFLVEVGLCGSYKTPSLPVLRVQDHARALTSGSEENSSEAGRDRSGQHEQPRMTLGRKLDDKVNGWWSLRRGVTSEQALWFWPAGTRPMRLLDTHTGRFVDVHDPNSVEYAVLSHTWDPTGEQSYHNVLRIHASLYLKVEAVVVYVCLAVWWRLLLAFSVVLQAPTFLTHSLSHSQKLSGGHPSVGVAQRLRRAAETIRSWNSSRFSPRLSTKIRRACAVARAYGHRLMWIDSCCIDKASSSELSEAINSMYAWYRGATVCYAFLADVPSPLSRAALDARSWTSTVAFRKSRWFRRGWTLQELIAPRVVVFLSMEWQFLGTKSSLAQVIEEVTGIYSPVLRQQMVLSEVPVAKRMSWAANRETTRREDEAYSLLGIFDISMSTLYGEGARAFIRLQEEILKRIPDQSLFAWGVSDNGTHSFQFPLSSQDIEENSFILDAVGDHYPAFFAPSPRSFRNSNGIRPLLHHGALIQRIGFNSPLPNYTLTPYGIHTHFPLIPANHCFPPCVLPGTLTNCYFAILACELEGQEGSLLAVICSAERTTSGSMLLNGRRISKKTNRRLLHRTTAIHYNRVSEHRIVVLNSTILPELLRLSRRLSIGGSSPVYVPIENPLPSSRAWYTWSGAVQLTAWSTTILRQLGYAVSCSTDSDSTHTLSLARGETRFTILHRRSRPRDPDDPFVVVWVTPTGREPTQLGERPSVTLDLRKICDCQEFAFDALVGRRVMLRFTLSYMFISFFLDVEVLDETLAGPLQPTSTASITTECDAEVLGTEDSPQEGFCLAS